MTQSSSQTGRLSVVVRTCIGCRQRADKATLVRIVAVTESTKSVVHVDPARILPGRGAHLHPTAQCLELAIRRKAFGRALKIQGHIDTDRLTAYVASLSQQD
jgi:predicted RNA-binding protein YlxR (DUF448 family)